MLRGVVTRRPYRLMGATKNFDRPRFQSHDRNTKTTSGSTRGGGRRRDGAPGSCASRCSIPNPEDHRIVNLHDLMSAVRRRPPPASRDCTRNRPPPPPPRPSARFPPVIFLPPAASRRRLFLAGRWASTAGLPVRLHSVFGVLHRPRLALVVAVTSPRSSARRSRAYAGSLVNALWVS